MNDETDQLRSAYGDRIKNLRGRIASKAKQAREHAERKQLREEEKLGQDGHPEGLSLAERMRRLPGLLRRMFR